MIDMSGLVKFLEIGNSMVPVTSQRIAPIRYIRHQIILLAGV